MAPRSQRMSSRVASNGEIVIRLTAHGSGRHHYALRADNLRVRGGAREIVLRDGVPTTLEWTARRVIDGAPWTAVVMQDGDVSRRRELFTP